MPNTCDTSLAYLDLIPNNIYQKLISHQYRVSNDNVNSLQKRSLGVLDLRANLLQGKSINKDSLLHWLDIDVADFLYKKLNDRALLSKAHNNDSLVDDVILNVLNWLENTNQEFNLFSEMTEEGEGIYEAMQEINKSFALERSVGWDLLKGVEYKTDLDVLISAHEIIENNKKIKSIIKIIGKNKRNFYNVDNRSGLNQLNIEDDLNEGLLPNENTLNSVTGVCFGDDVSRMLSSELAMLGNAKFKMFWHVKRAERQLLNYHFKGLLSDHVPEVLADSINYEVNKNKLVKEWGPIILCVDTSASMKGRAETVSKAIALEVMRISHLEKRACYLFCFGNLGEIIQFELNLNAGWKTMIEFLRLSFNGGTDVNTVFFEVLKKHEEKKWKNADILLISDGLFGVNEDLLARIKSLKTELRIFGIKLAKWNAQAFNEICHKVFDFSDD